MYRRLASPEEIHGALEHGYALIEEPFTPEQLTRRLAEVLAASRSTEWPK